MKRGYTMRTVSQLTGLSGDVLRAWERRYDAVRPARTAGNQRIYSEDDVHRLQLLARAVASGIAIGRAAQLSNDALEAVLPEVTENEGPQGPVEELVGSAVQAAKALDAAGVERVLARASVTLGQIAAIDRVIVPLMRQIGTEWHEGEMRIMHEHLASAVVRSFMGAAIRAAQPERGIGSVVIATPPGQRHELGAMACAILAASIDLHVTYLGADVPADDILAAVDQTKSQAVILSVVFPHSIGRVEEELSKLRARLPANVRLIVGGPSASRLVAPQRIATMDELREALSEIYR